MAARSNLKGMSGLQLSRLFREMGIPDYRVGQLLHWIYTKYATEIPQITEFSKQLRERLEARFYISSLALSKKLVSSDSTEKFLFTLEDGHAIESVLIPEKDRLTLCISSQVGCAMGCRFCMTGELGFVRNLLPFEILDQIVSANRMIGPKKITNIVLMGMGEPLANFENVLEALKGIVDLIGISKRKITLSTAGLAPRIALLGQKGPGVNLAVSLNASSDAIRDAIMPINRKFPIRTLLAACRNFPLAVGRRITFEYVLIDGVNDGLEDALKLAKLLKGLRCKVNLIPLNPHEGSTFRRPPEQRIIAFQEVLIRNDFTALIRESRGRDILAACGQLKGRA